MKHPARSPLVAVLFAVLVSWPQTGLSDQAVPVECYADLDCAAGSLCSGYTCVSEASVCLASPDCASDEVCDFVFDTCPDNCGTTCPERCQAPNGSCVSTIPYCLADADCDPAMICVPWRAPVCASADAACEETVIYDCVESYRFCDPEAAPDDACYSGEVCNEDGRCVAAELLEPSEAIEIDPEREEAVRGGDHAEEPSGCSVGRVVRGSGLSSFGWLALFVGAAAWLSRRRCTARDGAGRSFRHD